jgi:hypothetical protein
MTDRRMARGMMCSAVLHLLIALLLLRMPWPQRPQPPQKLEIPIDLVELGEQTASVARTPALPQARASSERPTPVQKPEPLDPLSEKLHRLAQNQLQDTGGISNVDAGNGVRGDAAYGIKDYLRAQIERRWVLPEGALLRNDWVVRLHLHIKEDGSVTAIDIVDDPRMGEDRDFREFAFSARNAARLSSPLVLPPQFAGEKRDVVLDFNARRSGQ